MASVVKDELLTLPKKRGTIQTKTKTKTSEEETTTKTRKTRRNQISKENTQAPPETRARNKRQNKQCDGSDKILSKNRQQFLEHDKAKAAIIKERNNNNCVNLASEEQYNKNLSQRLEAISTELDEPKPDDEPKPNDELETGYTHQDLEQFLANSTIGNLFPSAVDRERESNIQVFRRLNNIIYGLQSVQLDQLLDLYHLAIMMMNYQKQETHCMGYRLELLNAVAELSVELQPEYIEYIGISLCDRFVIGTGKERMKRVVDMQNSLTMLINNNSVNCHIAMTALLATFSKVSGVPIPEPQAEKKIIKEAFTMVQLVNWTQLVETGREPDIFILVRSFSLIINSKQNRTNWDENLGKDIHKFFMTILRTVRFSSNYNFFVMMVERFIAFCVVPGSGTGASSLDDLESSSI